MPLFSLKVDPARSERYIDPYRFEVRSNILRVNVRPERLRVRVDRFAGEGVLHLARIHRFGVRSRLFGVSASC